MTEDARFTVHIRSWSLLGFHYRRIQSVSVGYKLDYDMHSLDNSTSFSLTICNPRILILQPNAKANVVRVELAVSSLIR